MIAHLQTALEHRSMISQAIGIVMARYPLSSVAAFDVLRRLSTGDSTKLYDIASVVVQKVQDDAAGR